jgi:ParB-like chromosome segregation protein Spo0J
LRALAARAEILPNPCAASSIDRTGLWVRQRPGALDSTAISKFANPTYSEPTMNLKPIYEAPERLNAHPICLLMPSADEDELQNLTDDIRAHGLLDPIVLFEKRILDGRNRAAACESAGVAPRYVEFEGTREEALMFVVSHNLKRRHLTKQAIADTLVAAEDFNLHYDLGEPATRSDIKMSAEKSKSASSRELAKAAGGVVSREMINATRKVKQKAEAELQEAVKRGRIGVQDAAKAADLPPEQQKAIAASPKPRRAAKAAIEAAENRAARSANGDGDPRAALRKAWEKATALRRLWEAADNGTREWFMGAVWFDLNEADHRKQSSAVESLDERADEAEDDAAG